MSNVTVHGESMFPTETARRIIQDILPEWQELFLRKNAGYGEMHAELGLKAQYVDIHRKVGKLRRAMWESKPIGEEDIHEVLFDLIAHCFLTLDLIEQEARSE